MAKKSLKALFGRVPFARSLYLGARSQIRYCRYARDFSRFAAMSGPNGRFSLSWKQRQPQLDDATAGTAFDRHYVFHTAWAARILAATRPEFHVDISSSLFFVSLVSAFIPVRFYDYRPADLQLGNLTSAAGDLMKLPFADRSVESLSCMHVVEHIGLGRYGDPLDPDGDLKAIAELIRVLAPGGSLLFVVPIGKPVICFNAHRIYSYEQVVKSFNGLKLEQFALIPQDSARGGLIENASPEMADNEDYGCGCFWFRRQ